MHCAKRIPIAALAVMTCLAGSGAAFAEWDDMDNNGQRIFGEVLNASTTLIEAIGVAERQTGGRTFQINAYRENGSIFYEIKSAGNGAVFITTIDPTNGKVVKSENQGQFYQPFDDENSGELDKFAGSSATLAQMIETAEKHLGGTAVEAGFEDRDENENGGAALVAEVKIIKENAVKKVLVDVVTNTVVAVRNAEE